MPAYPKHLIHKFRLGRLALFMLTNKTPRYGTPPVIGYSYDELLELAITRNRNVSLRDALWAHDVKLTTILDLVPFALTTELSDYVEKHHIEKLTYMDMIDFLFERDSPWVIRDFILGVKPTDVREIASRIIELLKKELWDDEHWYTTDLRDTYFAGWRFKSTITKALVKEMAFIETFVSLVDTLGNLDRIAEEVTKLIKEKDT